MQTITCVACGAPLDVDADDPNWSVRTEDVGGVECVVERHLSVACRSCGRTETTAVGEDGQPLRIYNLVVENVDPPEPV